MSICSNKDFVLAVYPDAKIVGIYRSNNTDKNFYVQGTMRILLDSRSEKLAWDKAAKFIRKNMKDKLIL
jgi:hypothetical protein